MLPNESVIQKATRFYLQIVKSEKGNGTFFYSSYTHSRCINIEVLSSFPTNLKGDLYYGNESRDKSRQINGGIGGQKRANGNYFHENMSNKESVQVNGDWVGDDNHKFQIFLSQISEDQINDLDNLKTEVQQTDIQQLQGEKSRGKQSRGKQSQGRHSRGRHSRGRQSSGKQSEGKQTS